MMPHMDVDGRHAVGVNVLTWRSSMPGPMPVHSALRRLRVVMCMRGTMTPAMSMVGGAFCKLGRIKAQTGQVMEDDMLWAVRGSVVAGLMLVRPPAEAALPVSMGVLVVLGIVMRVA